MIFTIHTCSNIHEHFHLTPFHTYHSATGTDWAQDSPADGGNATHVDVNCHKTQQKKSFKDGKCIFKCLSVFPHVSVYQSALVFNAYYAQLSIG